jgi:hypothetical protein
MEHNAMFVVKFQNACSIWLLFRCTLFYSVENSSPSRYFWPQAVHKGDIPGHLVLSRLNLPKIFDSFRILQTIQAVLSFSESLDGNTFYRHLRPMMGTGSSFSGGKAAGGWYWPLASNLVPRSRKCGSVRPLPIHLHGVVFKYLSTGTTLPCLYLRPMRLFLYCYRRRSQHS